MTAHTVKGGREIAPHFRPRGHHSSGLATMAAKTPPAPCIEQERSHFAARLRNGHGLVLKEVADAFGVAEATWSRWEKQERFPSPAKLRLLSEFIRAPICCFFCPEPGSCPGNQKKPDEPPP